MKLSEIRRRTEVAIKRGGKDEMLYLPAEGLLALVEIAEHVRGMRSQARGPMERVERAQAIRAAQAALAKLEAL